MTSSEPTYLPKSPPQNIVILGLGLRHMNLLGDTNIQSITGPINRGDCARKDFMEC